MKNIDMTKMTNLLCKVTLPKCFLNFIHHYMNIPSETIVTCHRILLIETYSVISVDLHNVMQGLKDKMENRLNDLFYGATFMKSILSLQPNEQVMFKKKLIKCTKKLLII